jgi:hypothetical protein
MKDHTHRTGIFRRELLQVGFLGAFGMMLPSAFAAPAPKGKPRGGGGGLKAKTSFSSGCPAGRRKCTCGT